MKRYIYAIVFCLIASFMFAACTTPEVPVVVQKDIYGLAPIFADSKGFYENNPDVIQTDSNTRYVYFTTNEKADVQGDIIAVRKGTKTADGWTYGDKKIVLKTESGKWDSVRVSNPSVVKGAFAYKGKTYSYLMAYCGNSKNAASEFQIGFAVSETPDGEFIRTASAPYVQFSASWTGGAAFGAREPSLVSYDKGGKVRLFYTYADAHMTSSRVMELDMSDMSAIKDGGYVTLSSSGVAEGEKLLANLGVTWSQSAGKFYIIRDRFPKAGEEPKNAISMSVMSATTDWLYKPNHDVDKNGEEPIVSTSGLKQIKNITEDDVFVEGKDGWSRLYSGTFITDAYGHALSESVLEFVFSVNVEQLDENDTTYVFKSVICLLIVNIA